MPRRSATDESYGWDWQYLSKFVLIGDASVGKSALLLRVTDDRFLAEEAEPTVGVEFGSVTMPLGDEDEEDADAAEGQGTSSVPAAGPSSSSSTSTSTLVIKPKKVKKSTPAERVKIQIWDTAGSEAFRGITRSYYRGAAGCLLVYDVTHRPSFEHCKTWLKDVREHAEEDAVVVLVGNRCDLVGEEKRVDENADGEASTATATASATAQGKRKVTEEEARKWAEEEQLLFLETSAKTGHNVHLAFKTCVGEIHRRFIQAQAAQKSTTAFDGSTAAASSGGGGANLLKSRTASAAAKGGRRGGLMGAAGEGLNLSGSGSRSEGDAASGACCTVM